MSARPDTTVRSHRYVESAMTGIAAACALVVLGAFAVASFKPSDLPTPYWGPLDWLRTDTAGAVCFAVGILAFGTSEYLRMRRRAGEVGAPLGPPSDREPSPPVLAVAVARTLAIAAGGVVLYLSVNAVTHPLTLALPASHLLAWPTEGTLRVFALIVVAVAAAVARAQRIQLFGGTRVG